MVQPHYVNETRVLHEIASDPDCCWRFTTHALEEMRKDGWSAPDVKNAVMNGQVMLQEQKRDRLWRVEGRDFDGRRIQVVVAVYEQEITIKVITAF